MRELDPQIISAMIKVSGDFALNMKSDPTNRSISESPTDLFEHYFKDSFWFLDMFIRHELYPDEASS